MTIRAEVQPDQTIELMRPHPQAERNVFHKNLTLDEACILFRYYMRRDLERANKTKFVSRATKEARQAFQQLLKTERNPYHGKEKR